MIVRKIDELGRIVVPAEFRRELKLEGGDEVGMELLSTAIYVTPMAATCRYCGAVGDLVSVGDWSMCRQHVRVFAEQL